jgi:tRNA C32,U32 (ribose-2'-O)-methylase TrmJ
MFNRAKLSLQEIHILRGIANAMRKAKGPGAAPSPLD